MDLNKNGLLLAQLRKARGLTQKQVADKLGLVPKTISKWETGNGFPDVLYISSLADIYGVNTETILSGSLKQNSQETGNMKRTKFYVCPDCGAILYGTGKCQISCCGKQLDALKSTPIDDAHRINVSEMENDFYITFEHEMTKEHFIGFASYVAYDRVLMIRLYPEQDAAVRFPKMHGGRFFYYCSNHGLFEYKMQKKI